MRSNIFEDGCSLSRKDAASSAFSTFYLSRKNVAYTLLHYASEFEKAIPFLKNLSSQQLEKIFAPR